MLQQGQLTARVRDLRLTNRPLTFLAVLAAAIPATSGTERGLVLPGLRLSEALSVLLILLAMLMYRQSFGVGLPLVGICFAYATIYSALNLYNFGARGETSSTLLAQETLGAWPYFALLLAAANLGRNVHFLRRFLELTLALATGQAVLGMFQILRVQPALDLATRVTGNQLIANLPDWKAPRSVGLFNSWHAYGAYLAIAIVLCVAMLLWVDSARARRWRLLQLGTLCIGVASSLTFAPIMLAFIAASYLAMRAGRGTPVIAAVTALVLVAAASPVGTNLQSRIDVQTGAGAASGTLLPQTIAFRISIWREVWWPYISASPFTGFGRPRSLSGDFAYAESMYILLLLIGGIPLLIIFIALILAAWRLASRARTYEATLVRISAEVLFIVLPLFLVFMLIHPYFTDAGGSQLMFLLFGVLASPQSGTAPTVEET
jgi:hypothetical protein